MGTILVVSHDGHNRELISNAAADGGHRVYKLSGVESLVPTVEKIEPSLVIIDLVSFDPKVIPLLRGMLADSTMANTTVVGILSMPTRRTVLDLAQLGFQGLLVHGPRLAESLQVRLRHWMNGTQANETEAVVKPHAARSVGAAPQQKVVPDAAMSPGETAAIAGEAVSREIRTLEQSMQELKRIKPLIGRAELIKIVDDGADLRAMRPVVQRVLSAMSSPSCSAEDVARAIKQDHALSLKVMRLANSALYSRGDKVETIGDAVKRIGLSQLRQAIMGMSVVEQFSRSYLDGRVDSGMCWEHAIGVGLIASRIGQARGLNSDATDALFTAGLLHDVGRMILFEQSPQLMRQVVETSDALGLPWEVVESRLLLLNHAEVTDRVLRGWKFPPYLTNLIANHHLEVREIRDRCPAEALDAITLALADRLAHIVRLGGSGNDTLYPIEEFCSALHLGDAALHQALEGIESQSEELKLCMLAASTGVAAEPPPAPLADVAPRAHLFEDASEVQWLRMAWERMGGLSATPEDTLVVARLTRKFSAGDVAAKLTEQFPPHAGTPWQVVLLTPPGVKVDREAFGQGSEIAVIEEPIPVRELAQAVQQFAQRASSSAMAA
ncbi:MAG: HDOD domain-containing protein [Phycisphaeraceae bacterium]|nr:HDOD domain-containing protein [Phycisphaeraceae bacterium]